MKKLFLFLSQKQLLKVHKSFVRPNSDYADITYGKPFNESFKTKIEMIQYRTALVVTGAIKDIMWLSLSRNWLRISGR